jgi:hypothetical protein
MKSINFNAKRTYFFEDKLHNVFCELASSRPATKYVKIIAEKYKVYNEIVVKYPVERYHINIKLYDDDWYPRENIINCSKTAGNADISPKFIEFIELGQLKVGYYENEKKHKYCDVRILCCIITEKYGISLLEKYLNNDVSYGGPGPDSKLILECFDDHFPSLIPENIRQQIMPLLQKLESLGYKHDDVHAGNFLVKDDVVKIIDFDCVTPL